MQEGGGKGEKRPANLPLGRANKRKAGIVAARRWEHSSFFVCLVSFVHGPMDQKALDGGVEKHRFGRPGEGLVLRNTG